MATNTQFYALLFHNQIIKGRNQSLFIYFSNTHSNDKNYNNHWIILFTKYEKSWDLNECIGSDVNMWSILVAINGYQLKSMATKFTTIRSKSTHKLFVFALNITIDSLIDLDSILFLFIFKEYQYFWVLTIDIDITPAHEICGIQRMYS